ncbi:uncharacterized protein C8A04DRAFT_12017 [Dichotomopilus funicola]|uniref:DUF4045 domain-containing protein n=1 Tax=Dichotomopilus funicola TaxID=1934379 RepID=A0AAN6ZNU1_9PEZI|nr:hypothetical protein C8A04DRAFT_12017 [Dichotomopilus funicola]
MSDEVSDFLRSVELLKERREEEDEARSRELEEKILQEKRERQARRAERARSISPQKSSPANTPPPTANRAGVLPSTADGTSLESPVLGSSSSPKPRTADLTSDIINTPTATEPSSSPTKENDSPFDSDTKRSSVNPGSPSIGMPARSPLSWQRRPTSQASDRPKSRPLSMVAAENAARTAPSGTEAAEPSVSRDQIALTLAGKDPSWFRQTADPGRGSGAFRKNQIEDKDTVDMPTLRTQLPGMTRELAPEPPKTSTTARPVTPTSPSNKLSSGFPLAGTPRLDPPASDGAQEEDTTASHRQSITSPGGRTSPTRPVSPTKGMGGFVQSAMMKRSDSVKRWSVNSPAGLQRVDSVRSNASNLDGAQRPTTPKSTTRPKSMLREFSDVSVFAAGGQDEKVVEQQESPALDRPSTPTGPKAKEDTEQKPSSPVSPSKTMDTRRWSPTKNSSWLGAALNKPESPKAKPAAPAPAQPAWMVELNKTKAQKATADLARTTSQPKKTEVKTGGLMRSTPMGASLKPSVLGGFPVVPPISTADKQPVDAFRGNLRRASPTAEDPSESQGDPAAVAKPQPEAPATKDFRANLKPRAPPPGPKPEGSADELKNVVGSLRRTKTQNYVAPDELKDNILRGKAALNLTGGPKKTERKDEFKEAILKKKDDFKKAQEEGRGITREPSSASEKSVPEGIAKKLQLQRTGTFSKQTSATPDLPPESPAVSLSNRSSHTSTRSRHDIPTLASREATSEAITNPAPPIAPQKTGDAPSLTGGKIGGLANRFNPALASLIARGPPGAAVGPKSSASTPASDAQGTTSTEPPAPGPQLTHMTKNRARGPKRKAPTSVAASVAQPKEEPVRAAAEPERKSAFSPPEPKKMTAFPPLDQAERIPSPKMEQTPVSAKSEAPVVSPKPEKFTTPASGTMSLAERRKSLMQNIAKPTSEVISLVDSSRHMPKEEPKPVGEPIAIIESTPAPIKTRARSPTKVHEQVAALAALTGQSPNLAEPSPEIVSQPSSPKKLDMKRMSRFMDETAPESPAVEPVKSRPSSPVKDRSDSVSGRPTSLVRERTKSITGRPVSLARERAESITGRPISLVRDRADSFRSRSSSPVKERFPGLDKPSLKQQQGNEPVDLKPALPVKTGPSSFGGTGLGLTQPVVAPTPNIPQPQEAEQPPALPPKTSRPLPAPPPSQRAQLIQLTSEGKKIPVPSHYERVLFEREMYLCPHTYLDPTGRKVNEVYFWAGDEVPESQIDDAHLFAAREARALGGRLVKLTQGKETSGFLQALGGIIIVRRGSSNKYDSLAPNMLCGRRYLGQVAFDEVDFSPLSLCSGFPYLITQQGKCYLWKGKGSDVEELGCARLVGMDLALMGELLEVEEGKESASFWQIFGGSTRPSSADHWRLKPNYDKYCGRLFCASSTDKHQSDLHPSHIYVLDAFFELYIIVGARSQHQYAAFRNALDFVSEYSIHAATMEDRPFMPTAHVVLGGIPRDLKSVFRKWKDGNSPTMIMPVSGGSGGANGSGSGTSSPLKRARSLRVVPLAHALQAFAD